MNTILHVLYHDESIRSKSPKDKILRSNAVYNFCQNQLALLSQQPPEQLQLQRSVQGKPFFQSPKALDWNFSISHCHAFSLCVIAREPVSIDAELLRPLRHHRQLTRRILGRYKNSNELLKWFGDHWDELEYREQQRFFFRLWTLSECVSKLYGFGLWYGFQQLTCAITLDPNILLKEVSHRIIAQYPLQFLKLSPDTTTCMLGIHAPPDYIQHTNLKRQG